MHSWIAGWPRGPHGSNPDWRQSPGYAARRLYCYRDMFFMAHADADEQAVYITISHVRTLAPSR